MDCQKFLFHLPIPYPIAAIVSQGAQVAYSFMSDSFKRRGQPTFHRRGDPLPDRGTRLFSMLCEITLPMAIHTVSSHVWLPGLEVPELLGLMKRSLVW